ncbi:AP-3 complex subunit sigma-1 isoform X2 [Vidua chalybeata]|uniref:AP-3 complex subunit sigma-1 isoform X2 n=1 Tax=Vidua chalybeata TaxID=81927 RepID=UPI0023A8A383|nr:AP-3 complex subunit sigma-1 isoform X2 [Vidua chalybeata]
MIKAILIFNNHGKPRLSKFYQRYSEDTQQQIIRETFHLVSKRDENVCNFLEGGLLIGGSDNKLIYRHYATLYFVFCVDSSESELGILDLIQRERDRELAAPGICRQRRRGTGRGRCTAVGIGVLGRDVSGPSAPEEEEMAGGGRLWSQDEKLNSCLFGSVAKHP